jgi:hypothetical protein
MRKVLRVEEVVAGLQAELQVRDLNKLAEALFQRACGDVSVGAAAALGAVSGCVLLLERLDRLILQPSVHRADWEAGVWS